MGLTQFLRLLLMFLRNLITAVTRSRDGVGVKSFDRIRVSLEMQGCEFEYRVSTLGIEFTA